MRLRVGDVEAQGARVFLNDVELDHVTAVDTDERWIERYLTKKDGSFLLDRLGHLSIERVSISRDSVLRIWLATAAFAHPDARRGMLDNVLKTAHPGYVELKS